MNLQKTKSSSSKAYNVTNRLTTVLLIVYLIALYWILLFKLGTRFSYTGGRSINLIPFSKPLVLNGKPDVGEIVLNVVIFIPLGLYAGILFKRWSFGKKLLCFLLISLLVEVLQFTLAIGVFDITDIITNISGGVIGLLLLKVIETAFSDSVRAQKFINLIAAIGTVIIILFLLLLKMNMLPIRYQ